MIIPPEARLLRIYLNASDRWHGKPLYQVIVETARAAGIAGASVFPVETGYGAHHRLHDSWSEYEFTETPIVVEMVDGPEQIETLLVKLGTMVQEGLATIEAVRVIRYSHGPSTRVDT
jgi:uncharacterized protein